MVTQHVLEVAGATGLGSVREYLATLLLEKGCQYTWPNLRTPRATLGEYVLFSEIRKDRIQKHYLGWYSFLDDRLIILSIS
jgi:hypothetical protein